MIHLNELCQKLYSSPSSFITDDKIKESLSKIKNNRCQGQRLDTYNIHSFPARMPLSLAELLIENLSLPDGLILDPMSGSGTTVLAAKKNRRIGIGFDLDPLAVILAKVITTNLNPIEIEQVSNKVYNTAKKLLNEKKPVKEFLKNLTSAKKAFIDFWFPKQAQEELTALSLSIQEIKKTNIKNFFWVVFSSLIINKNNGASYAIDITRSRPHRKLDKNIVFPLNMWFQKVKKAKSFFSFYNLNNSSHGSANIYLGDARNLGIEDNTIEMVLTSPPYLQAVDYIRCHKFSLVWMGYQLETLREIRASAIGAQRGIKTSPIPGTIEEQLLKISNSQKRGWVRRYIVDMIKAISEIGRVLKPGGIAVLVVGPNVFSKKRYDAVEVFRELITASGLNMVDAVPRRLPDNRRSLPAPRSVGSGNALKKRLKTEYVIAFRKPFNR